VLKVVVGLIVEYDVMLYDGILELKYVVHCESFHVSLNPADA
jgi:hypothetical protein